ncbi:MAG: alanine racemase [Acidimicrobiales bacterium]
MRPAWAEVDLGAIAHNVRVLIQVARPAALCAVVKADGYGHGAVPVARAALDAGAAWLGVALAEEGVTLRDAGLDAPVLVLSEPQPAEMDLVAGFGLRPTVYSARGVDAAAKAAVRTGHAPLPVHLKVDTGMHRVGADPADALRLARMIAGHPELSLEGLWTHCALTDEPDNPFTAEQLKRFRLVVDELAAAGLRPPLLHAANSAGAIAHPATRLDMVRCGIAVYGIPPSPGLDGAVDLRPAMSVKAQVSLVKRVAAGEGISYEHRYFFERDSVVATVPIGYADGVRRRLYAVGGEVLIGGRRRPIRGVVTMDQLMVDCGDDESVQVGDEVVLIGDQSGERITADDWAARLDSIGYEIVCGIGPRVPRRYR